MEEEDDDWYGIRLGNFLISTWALGSYFPEDSGVDAWIYTSSRLPSSIPFIIITLHHTYLESYLQDGFIISIGKKPRILWPKGKTIEPKVWQQIVLWIQLNRRGLELLWYYKIDDGTFCRDFFTKI